MANNLYKYTGVCSTSKSTAFYVKVVMKMGIKNDLQKKKDNALRSGTQPFLKDSGLRKVCLRMRSDVNIFYS